MNDLPRRKQFERFYDGNVLHGRVNLQTSGTTCKPSGYAEYDGLTGYVEQTYTREWTDQQGNRWRKITTVINLGKPDRGIPVDPDAQIQAEPLPRQPRPKPKNRKPQTHKRRELLGNVVAYLTEYGPAHAKLIARDLGMAYETIFQHLRKHKGATYCECGKVGKAVIWGVKGVHDAA